MFDVSMSEIIVILVVALIVLGPRQLAEAARVMGKLYRDLQKMSWEIRQNVNLETLTSSLPDKKEPADDRTDNRQSAADVVPEPGEKWGADFYANLLEAPQDTDRIGENGAEKPPATEDTGPRNKDESKQEPGS